MTRTDRPSSTNAAARPFEPRSCPVGVIGPDGELNSKEGTPSESQLLQAFAAAMIAAFGTEDKPKSDEFRRAASVAHMLGIIYRRQERCDDARRAHLAALHLRDQHGSFEELWETAIELALDARIDGRWADSRRWSKSAIDYAKTASEQPHHKQALAWGDLSRMLTESGDHNDAIDAADEAIACWNRYDVGAIDAARAQQLHGQATLGHAQQLSESGSPEAGAVLDCAIERLDAARAALEAFGPVATADAQSCRDGLDFAQRLRASVDE